MARPLSTLVGKRMKFTIQNLALSTDQFERRQVCYFSIMKLHNLEDYTVSCFFPYGCLSIYLIAKVKRGVYQSR